MTQPPRNAPPRIFSSTRRLAVRGRMLKSQAARPDAARFLMEDMVEDVEERLGFLRFTPKSALIVGEWTGALAGNLTSHGVAVTSAEPADGFDEEMPFPEGGFDLIASLGTLDTVNDLPGALIHIRNALAPGGLMIASFIGAGSLPILRSVMLAADSERPGPRMHPAVDVRAGGQLLQRTGFADPVIDSRPFNASYRTLDRLVQDIREQGLSNVLADPGLALNKTTLARARAAFAALGEDGRTAERFEILTLSGWRR